MTILLVRHARAGRRSSWRGEDLLRPLSAKGRVQADRLPALLVPWTSEPSPVLLASPWVRCVQTLGPLAHALGVGIIEDHILGEGMALKAAPSLGKWLGPRPTVLCTHGDVIEGILAHLIDNGVDLGPKPTAAKGSVWVIEGTADKIRSAHYLPPPA